MADRVDFSRTNLAQRRPVLVNKPRGRSRGRDEHERHTHLTISPSSEGDQRMTPERAASPQPRQSPPPSLPRQEAQKEATEPGEAQKASLVRGRRRQFWPMSWLDRVALLTCRSACMVSGGTLFWSGRHAWVVPLESLCSPTIEQGVPWANSDER